MKIEYKSIINSVFFLVPILVIFLVIFGARKKDDILTVLKLKYIYKYRIMKLIIGTLGLCLIAFSLLGPQKEIGVTEVQGKGLDIYVLMDTSKSMLVEDVSPSRLDRAKKVVEAIIGHLKGDRIGFIPYSSSAYIQMPLTDDYELAKMFLDVIDTDMIGGGGTDVGKAIDLANKSFDEMTDGDKVIIILSDGEEYDAHSDRALKEIQDQRLKVYTIGIGTTDGGLIPVYDDSGENRVDYMKDNSDELVMSKLDANMLKELASISNGTYYESSIDGSEIQLLMNDLSQLEESAQKAKKVNQYQQLYQIFLGLGILTLLVALKFPERSRKS